MLLENMLDRIDRLEARVNISRNLQSYNRSLSQIVNSDKKIKRNQNVLKAEGKLS